MKYWYSILAIILVFPIYISSQNLVPNHSFENYSQCPNGGGQLDYAIGWFKTTNASSDYYNICSSNLSVPSNAHGYQPAASGVAYAGIYVFSHINPSFREYISIKLLSTLKTDSNYIVSFNLCLTDNSMYGVNRIGAFLSINDPYQNINFGVLNSYVPQIENSPNNILTDTLNWTKIAGIYKAKGGEEYISIGNFYTDNKTEYKTLVNGFTSAHYYIDDVSIIQIQDYYDISLDSIIDTANCYSTNNSIELLFQNIGTKALDFSVDTVTFTTEIKVNNKVVQSFSIELNNNSKNPIPNTPLAPYSFMTIEISPMDLSRLGEMHEISIISSFARDEDNTNNYVYREITPIMDVGDVSVYPKIICSGDTVHLQSTNFTGNPQWQYSHNITSWQNLSIGANLIENPTENIYYRFKVCDDIYSDIFLVQVPKDYIGDVNISPSSICLGENVNLETQNFLVTPIWLYSNNGKDWQQLSTDATTTHQPQENIFYKVEGCPNVYADSVLVQVTKVPDATVFIDSMCGTGIFNIQPVVPNKVEDLNWYYDLLDQNPFHTGLSYSNHFESSLTYYIQTIMDNCASENKTPVHFIIEECSLEIPNVFTPNGDGINDIFYFHNAERKELFTEIYSRWGNLVASWKDNPGWDGADLPEGVYYYVIIETTPSGDKVYKGIFNLLR